MIGGIILNLDNFFNNAEEKPLDVIAVNGGYTSIFRTIACIGDSLSSGEFESANADGSSSYHDYYEYSWGQFLARMCGSRVYNFSRGGMTAREYIESFADENNFWDESLAAQCYIIALGVNDLKIGADYIGSIDDFNCDSPENSNKSFAGYYMQIIARLKKIQPRAKFFLVTMPDCGACENNREIKKAHSDLLYAIAEYFDNTYIIDLFKYSPVHNEEFKKHFYMRNHLNPMGYKLTADIIASYIDYIIRHNTRAFKEVAFIGTELHG